MAGAGGETGGSIIYRRRQDRISSLPPELLHHILSFLPLHEAIATSLLSSRWRKLWCTNPSLDLSFPFDLSQLPENYYESDPEMYASIVGSCMEACEKTPSVKSMSLHLSADTEESNFQRWMVFAKEKSVRALSLCFHHMGWEEQVDFDDEDDYDDYIERMMEGPTEIFAISSLEFLHLEQCKIPSFFHGKSLLPNLETLSLESVIPNKKSLNKFISFSPKLKTLKIAGDECKGEIVISSPTIETLDIFSSYLDVNCGVRIVDVPKLRVLGLCCDLEQVDLSGLSKNSMQLDEITMFGNPVRDFSELSHWRKLVSWISTSTASTLIVDYWLLQNNISCYGKYGTQPPVFSNLRNLQICGWPLGNSWFHAIVEFLIQCPILEKLNFQHSYFGTGDIHKLGNFCGCYHKKNISDDFDFESDKIIQEFKNCTKIVRNLKIIEISGHEGYADLIKLMYIISCRAHNLERVLVYNDERRENIGFDKLLEFKWVSNFVKVDFVEVDCCIASNKRWEKFCD